MSVNNPFKGALCNVLGEPMESMNQAELNSLDDATDLVIGRRRVLMTRAVAEAWELTGSFSLLPYLCLG